MASELQQRVLTLCVAVGASLLVGFFLGVSTQSNYVFQRSGGEEVGTEWQGNFTSERALERCRQEV
jgi:di/tricarboxylate transporter